MYTKYNILLHLKVITLQYRNYVGNVNLCYLITALVANNYKHSTMTSRNTIFNQCPDPIIDFLTNHDEC